MHVRFTSDQEVRDHHQQVIESFRAGQVVDFSDRPTSGQRWINRGFAIDVKEEAEAKEAADKQAAADASAQKETVASKEKTDAAPSSTGLKGGDGGGGDGADHKGKSKGGAPGGRP